MDNRVRFRIPDHFAFMIRAGGANLKRSEFYVSYAIAVGGVDTIALIGHTDCGMVNLTSREDLYVQGLVDRAGWNSERANDYFIQSITENGIGHEVDFVVDEAERMRLTYPEVDIVPMLYRVEDNFLYLIQEPAIEEVD